MARARVLALRIGVFAVALVASRSLHSSAAQEPEPTRLPVAVTVEVTSRFAEQGFVLTGWIEVTPTEPRVESGLEVFDLQVDSVHLQGASQLGVINVEERPDSDGRYVSRGEVRALQAGTQFPASSYIDLYGGIFVPESILGNSLSFHNELALRLIAEAPLAAWPSLGTIYGLEPLFDVDNDGDGATDEDTPDEDGDVYVDEDRIGPDPVTPGLPPQCGDDADCDGSDGEDPPPEGCSAVCDDDGDGAVDEDPNCLPLLNEANTSLPLGVCVVDLQFEVAPAEVSFSVAAGGPSRLHPADVLGLVPRGGTSAVEAPYVRIPCASLGLTATGCDDGSDGTQDDVDGLSYGLDVEDRAGELVRFSVGAGSRGVAGTAVEGQVNCPPASPGLAPEPDGDIFASRLDGGNDLLFDGNGPIGSCTVGFPLGLVEASTRRDDLDAVDGHDVKQVDANGDGVPEQPVYFSLTAGSPSLGLLGFTAGDILVTRNGGTPTLFASGAQLDVMPGGDLDAFCLQDDGNTIYSAGDLVYYSIAPRLQGSMPESIGPADILAPGAAQRVVRRALELGLRASDDLDALECQMVAPALPDGDVTCNGETNAVDALYVLQYDARLLIALPCPSNGDWSGDGLTNSLDASLILQFAAGLIGLPE